MIATESAKVELVGLGFVVTVEGVHMPKMMPGNVMVFHGRPFAEQYAKALDANNMTQCHEIIARHGRAYSY